MTTMFRIENGNAPCEFVHEEHECDTFEYLQNHKNKKMIYLDEEFYYNRDVLFEWFEIVLTQEDVDNLREQTWFHNRVHDDESINYTIKAGAKIEVLIFDYNPERRGKKVIK